MSIRTNLTLLLATIFAASCAPADVAIASKAPLLTKAPFPAQAVSSSSSSEPRSTDPIIITITQTRDYHAEVSYPPCKPLSSFDMPIPNAGCVFEIHVVDSSTQIDLGNSYQVKILTPVDGTKSLVTIVKDGNELYKTRIPRYTFSGLVSAWGYDDHWAIEVTTPNGLDVILDGESLRARFDYDEVCGFQILSGKPFYFFRKSGYGNGMFYDGIASHLDYDDIVCSNENPNSTMMRHYENMVEFVVKQNGAWKSALITTSGP